MPNEIASAAAKVAPSVGFATWAVMDWPWATIAAIAGTVYSVVMIYFLIYDRIKGKQ